MTESERGPQPQPADEERPPGGSGGGSAAPSSDNTPPRAPGPEPPARADPSGDQRRDDEDVLDPDDEGKLRQDAATINNVYGDLRADTAYLGSVDTRRGPSIGAIRIDAIRAALKAFCASDAFVQAEKVLGDHGMVVLIGGEGSGRYTSAIGLLAGWPSLTIDLPIVSFSPTTSIADLAKRGFKPDRRYLVHDMRGDGRASADQRFELGRLRQALSGAGARIVVTADATMLSRGDFGDLVVTWVPPDSGVVFDQTFSCSGLSLDAAEVARARAHAIGLARPGEVAAFVSRLADGVDAAMYSQADADRDQVMSWFEDKNRTLDEELAVVAACFLHRTPERIFERCLSRLRQLVREYDTDEYQPLAAPPTLSRSRQSWAGSDGLLSLIDDDDGLSERLLSFRSPYMRWHALDQVWSRYGYDLIQPLRLWIREVVRDTSPEVRVQTAIGVSMLAERRWSEVKESFLDPWSNDLYVYRAAAANTLSMMSASEVLAPRVLEVALDWSENQGIRRAMTAALALGGPLSIRYRDKAFEQLWYLTTRGTRIASVARFAMSVMLAGADDEPDRAMGILRTTVAALTWSTEHSTSLQRRRSITAVGTILAAERFTSDELVIAGLLRDVPEASTLIGTLLAAILESGPHHHQGVDLLRRLLNQLADADDPLALAGQLGATVFACWTEDVRRVLVSQIERAFATSAEDAELAREVVSSFLHAIALH